MEDSKKRVFISYAWEAEKKQDSKVKRFAQWLTSYLKKWNFDVQLDLYKNFPGSDLEGYMQEGINSSRFVICICTQTYLEKMKNPGTGVYNEINLLEQNASSAQIIPIVEKGMHSCLPDFFKGKFFSEFNMEVPFSRGNVNPIYELISTLRDEKLDDRHIQVESRIEDYYNRVELQAFRGKAQMLMQFTPQVEGKVTFNYLLNDKKFSFGLAPMKFTTKWSTAGDDTIYGYCVEKSMSRIFDFQNFGQISKPGDLRFEEMIPISWDVSLSIGDGLVWVNQDNFVAIGRICDVSLDHQDEFKSTVTLEYKILDPLNFTDEFVQEA